MNFEELKEIFNDIRADLRWIEDFKEIVTNEEIIKIFLRIETDLFRARIKLERELNSK